MLNKVIESKICNSKDLLNLVSSSILNKEENSSVLISFINPYSYDKIPPNYMNKIVHLGVDGQLLVFLSNLNRTKKIDRASFDFSSIARDVFHLAESNNTRVAFFGGSKLEIKSFSKNIKYLYPNLNIVFERDGYGHDKENDVKDLVSVNPDIVLIGMGTPLQEEWGIRVKELLNSPCTILTCGGFLTQTARSPDYYNPWIKKMSLRWLQRAFDDKHVRRRLVFDYPKFTVLYLLDIAKVKVKKFYR